MWEWKEVLFLMDQGVMLETLLHGIRLNSNIIWATVSQVTLLGIAIYVRFKVDQAQAKINE